METRQLEYFVTVAEESSFTAAAARLFAAQSTVSAGIKALEGELGASLFDRSTRYVRLSGAGAALLPEARALLASAVRAREVVRDSSDVLRGGMRVGTLTSLGLIDLPALFGAFHARHPHVDVHITTSPSGSTGLAEDLRHSRLDVALLGLPSSELGGLKTQELAAIPFVAVLPHDHPRAGQRDVALRELAGEPFVDTLRGFGNRLLVDRTFASAGTPRHVAVEVSDLSVVAEYVDAGMGVAVVPHVAPPPGSRVVVRPLRGAPLTFSLYVATPAGRRPSRAVQAFLALLADRSPSGATY